MPSITPNGQVEATSASMLEVGQEVLTAAVELSRADLVKYAGASGDFNTIHWNERFAKEVGLDNVIAHGMLTMATAITPLTDWLGDPGAILDYRTRFTNPVVVPDAESGSPEQPTVTLTSVIRVGAVDEDAGTARFDIDVKVDDTAVLGRTQVKARIK